MSISNCIFSYLSNKISFLLNSFENENELRLYNAKKDFLDKNPAKYDNKANVQAIWNSLFTKEFYIRQHEISEVYNIKRTYLYDAILEKMQFYIEKKFWNLLDRYEIDTWNWSDEQIFEVPSLYIYVIILKDGRNVIVIASLKEQKFHFIKSYEIQKLPLLRFKHRQLTYRRNVFYSI